MAKPYTAEMLKEFDRLTTMASSHDQVTRIDGRMRVSHFVIEHGREVCDQMFAELKRRDRVSKRKSRVAD